MEQMNLPATDLPPIMGVDQFRILAYKDAPIDPNAQLVCRDFQGDRVKVKAASAPGTFDFVMSTSSVDRDQDTISAKGFDLRAYKKAPIWLAFHDPREFIGVSTDIGVEGDKLFSTLKLGPTPMAKLVKDMIEFRLETKALQDAGASASVGFIPTKVDLAPKDSGREFGLDFTEQELLENSHVPIGSNRDALLQAKASGIDFGVAADWAARYRELDSGLVLINLKTAEAIVTALDPSKGMSLFQMPPAGILTLKNTPAPAAETAKISPVVEFSEEAAGNFERLIDTLQGLVDTLDTKAHDAPPPAEEPAAPNP